MTIRPYLFLDGRCEEALAFYRAAIGAEITALMRFRESPEPPQGPPPDPEKILHAAFEVGGMQVMASDGHGRGQPRFEGFALVLGVKEEAEAGRALAALAEGGQLVQPLIRTFFSPAFGMARDRFGVTWMVLVE